jgi:hypothetical protein
LAPDVKLEPCAVVPNAPDGTRNSTAVWRGDAIVGWFTRMPRRLHPKPFNWFWTTGRKKGWSDRRTTCVYRILASTPLPTPSPPPPPKLSHADLADAIIDDWLASAQPVLPFGKLRALHATIAVAVRRDRGGAITVRVSGVPFPIEFNDWTVEPSGNLEKK